MDDKYFLNPRSVHAILKEKGVANLYHANTVITSLTFIDENALLSRHYVDEGHHIQTDQKSDVEDKAYNVWDDVFLDAADLHKLYRRPNHYGPVLFAMKLDMLLSPSMPKMLVTKNNPIYWKDDGDWSKRYYSDVNEVKQDYLSGKRLDARIMFTLRSPAKTVKLNKFLDHIILDNPNAIITFKTGDKNVGEAVLKKIEESLKAGGLAHIPVHIRHKKGDNRMSICTCRVHYTWMLNGNYKEFKKRFSTNYKSLNQTG